MLTPHPLEAARLLGSDATAVQGDRLAAAGTLAERFGCTVLLKGSGTIVAQPGRAPSINPTGHAALASPGTGDVLAGWIGGLWASQHAADADGGGFSAAVAAAYVHGAAADAAGVPVLQASRLVERMAARAASAAFA